MDICRRARRLSNRVFKLKSKTCGVSCGLFFYAARPKYVTSMLSKYFDTTPQEEIGQNMAYTKVFEKRQEESNQTVPISFYPLLNGESLNGSGEGLNTFQLEVFWTRSSFVNIEDIEYVSLSLFPSQNTPHFTLQTAFILHNIVFQDTSTDSMKYSLIQIYFATNNVQHLTLWSHSLMSQRKSSPEPSNDNF